MSFVDYKTLALLCAEGRRERDGGERGEREKEREREKKLAQKFRISISVRNLNLLALIEGFLLNKETEALVKH